MSASERVDGYRGLISELLELLREEYPVQIQAARDAFASGDASVLQRVGYAMKGALGSLAASNASAIAAELEATGRSGETALATSKIDPGRVDPSRLRE